MCKELKTFKTFCLLYDVDGSVDGMLQYDNNEELEKNKSHFGKLGYFEFDPEITDEEKNKFIEKFRQLSK